MEFRKIFILLAVLINTTLVFAQENFISYWDRVKKREYSRPEFNETFKYIAKRDTESLYFYQYSQPAGVPLKAKSEVVVKCNPSKGNGDILPFENYGFKAYKDNEELICSMKDFALEGKSWIPNNITNSKWCMKYHYDVLKSRDRNTLSNYEWWINIFDEKLSDDFYVDNGGESASVKFWWQVYQLNPEILLTDCCMCINGFFNFYTASGYVIDIRENSLIIKWNSANYEICFIDAFDSIKTGQESTIEYYLDGDFLTIILDGTKIELAKKCDDFDTQWKSLIQDDYCSLDNIIWPHHADGTSEYEDIIRYPEPVIIKEPEEIKIEEYQEENKEKESEKPPIPDENDPNFLEILRVYYPEYYSSWAQVFKYRRRMQILKISIISAASLTVVIIAIIIIIKKKRRSAK